MPGLASITQGITSSPLTDFRAALTVWAVVVPQSLAYATLAGVPSVNGLYAAVGALAAYALFGTCRDLNMGAESTVAIMAAATVAPLVVDAGRRARPHGAHGAAGRRVVCARLRRSGSASSPTSCHGRSSRGTCSGRGSSSWSASSRPCSDSTSTPNLYTTDVGAVVRNLGDARRTDDRSSALSTVVLVLGILRRVVPRRFRRRSWPSSSASSLVAVFDLDQEGVAVVGDIESGVPVPRIPGVSFDQFTQLLLPSLGIALLAYPDSFLTARSLAAHRPTTTLDADQEFLADRCVEPGVGGVAGVPGQRQPVAQLRAGATPVAEVEPRGPGVCRARGAHPVAPHRPVRAACRARCSPGS